MAYTKYSLTPANNNAAPPDGAPEGMLPSAVNDTMRDMMAQIRDCGDGIRGGTYTMTAPVITGGSINGAAIGASSASTGSFTTLAYSSTLTGGTGVVNLGSGQFYKDASGLVGIGTTSPTAKFESFLTSTTNPSLRLRYNSTTYYADHLMNPNGNYVIKSPAANGVSSGNFVLQAGGPEMYFYTNDTERMRIDTNGQVGVGVTPKTWYAGTVAIQYGISASTINLNISSSDRRLYVINNAYVSASGTSYYTNTGHATQYMTRQGTHTFYCAPSGTAGDAVTYTEVITVAKDTSLALQGANIQTGTGITFPATQSASSDANTLDDYEEGTWTPTVSASGGGAVGSYSNQVGRYTKIGNAIVCYFYISFTKGTLSGNISFSLPFVSTQYNGAMCNYYNGLGTAMVNIGGYATAGQAAFEMHATTAASTSFASSLTASQLGASGNEFICTFTYYV